MIGLNVIREKRSKFNENGKSQPRPQGLLGKLVAKKALGTRLGKLNHSEPEVFSRGFDTRGDLHPRAQENSYGTQGSI